MIATARRSTRHRTSELLGVLLALALLAGACGGAEDADGVGNGVASTDATADDDDAGTGQGETVSLVAMHGSSEDFIVLVPLAAWDVWSDRNCGASVIPLELSPSCC